MSSPVGSMPRLSMHEALGAVLGDRTAGPRIASYGDTATEYAAAREGAGLVDLHERGLLEATGPTRQKFLQGMLSNEVAALQPGQGCAAAAMTARGALLALVRVLVEPQAVALETTADRLPALQRTLEHYRVAAPVRFAPRDAAVLAVLGPRAGQILAAAGADLPPATAEAHVGGVVGGEPVRVVRAGDLPGTGFVLHLAAPAVPAVWRALLSTGVRPVGRDALDALRVEALRPWYGSDVDESNLLHETGLVAECHASGKGCYVGQEIVARLEGRGGNVNKMLRGLRLSRPAEPGAAITAAPAGEGSAGRVTTAAVSPRLGPIAIGYLHRGQASPGTPVLVDGAPATVVSRFED